MPPPRRQARSSRPRPARRDKSEAKSEKIDREGEWLNVEGSAIGVDARSQPAELSAEESDEESGGMMGGGRAVRGFCVAYLRSSHDLFDGTYAIVSIKNLSQVSRTIIRLRCKCSVS